MPGQSFSELAQQIDVDRLQSQTADQDSRLDRDEVLIRQLQGSLKAALARIAVLETPIPVVTALPVAPVDNQRVVYRNPTAIGTGQYGDFLCRYSSAYHTFDGYGWVVLGGAPWYVQSGTAQRQLVNQTTYVNLPTDPQSFTLLLAGIYDVRVTAQIGVSAAGLWSAWVSYAVGATVASDAWGVAMGLSATTADVGGRTFRHTIATANTLIAEKAKTTGNFTGSYFNRRIEAMPVRFKS